MSKVTEFRSAELLNLAHTFFGRRWVRVAAYYGSPPGSHIGFWRTRAGTVHGWNLRIGKRYVGPCLTLLVHTRQA